MNWKSEKKMWFKIILILLILLVISGCSKYVAPKEPPDVVWVDTLGSGIGVVSLCKDHVVCYQWSGSMSCIKDYTLSDKYCALKNDTEVIE